MNQGVLISINDEIYDDDWMQNLIKGIPQKYGTNKILDAYEGMPVYYYIKNVGIKYRGTVINPNDGYPELNIEKELKPPMELDMMRKTGIIKKNPPQQTQYLNPNQLKTLEKL